MPAPLAVPFTRILWVWQLADGKFGTQGVFIRSDTAPTAAEMQAAAQAAFDAFSTDALRGDTSSQVVLNHCEAQQWNFSTGANPIVPVSSAQVSTGDTLAGSSSTQAVSSQDALTLTLQTALPGKRYRGRIYWTGYGETAANAGRVSSGLAAEVGDYYAAALAAAQAELPSTNDIIVVSRKFGLITPVVNIRANIAVHTQRRRALRV